MDFGPEIALVVWLRGIAQLPLFNLQLNAYPSFDVSKLAAASDFLEESAVR